MSKILIAPMDWGMGHAMRSVPLIDYFQGKSHEVIIGGAGDSLQYLKDQFPDLQSVELPAYNPSYHRNSSMVQAMARQLPRFIKVIKKELKVADELAEQYKLDYILSDHRYGMASSKCPSYFLSHQLNIQFPWGFGWVKSKIDKYQNQLLEKYEKVFVPDFEDHFLSGKLSKNDEVEPVFIGPLSRFPIIEKKKAEKKYAALILLSGPEPQRSVLEDKLLQQLGKIKGRKVLVRGTYSSLDPLDLEEDVEQIEFAESAQLQDLLLSSEMVIARAGFSSIMDFLALDIKKAALVPTPGQTEQEYLAERMDDQQIFMHLEQDDIDLEEVLEKLAEFKGFRREQRDKQGFEELLAPYFS